MFLPHQALGLAKLLLQELHALAQLFLRGQHVLDADVVVGGHTHRGTDATERPLYVGLVHIGTDEQPYGGVVIVGFQQVINRIHVEVELAGILGLELAGLELAHNVATQAYVVEQQIYLARAAAHDDLFLPPHEGESVAQFQQQAGDALAQRLLQLVLVVQLVAHGSKAKVVVFFEYLFCQL